MNTWTEHRHKLVEEALNVSEYKEVSQKEFTETVVNYFAVALRQPNLKEWWDLKNQSFMESAESSRYAIEVNYRTTTKDAQESFAKISLGYVSAALKAHGYHIKLVFNEKPIRVLVSSRNWDDGEWNGMVSYNPDHNCFILSKGFYNKERKTVSIQKSEKCKGSSGAELAADLRNMMHALKNTPDRHMDKLKKVNLRPGPKS